MTIKYQWFSIVVNLLVTIGLIISSVLAIRALKRHYATTFKREIQSITIILLTFTTCYLFRMAYEAYENIRNARQLKD